MNGHSDLVVRRLVLLCSVALALVLLGIAVSAVATQYVFQEPVRVTWSRYLMPEFLWQRQQYPSARWAFDLVEPAIASTDPRTTFVSIGDTRSLDRPENWQSDLAGPQPAGLPDPLPDPAEIVRPATAKALVAALEAARPGTLIELMPGTYDFEGTNLAAATAGELYLPIVVRAARLGSVRLRFALLEGFHVLAPYWVFENLVIEGVCAADSRCEHAFHVVGAAEGVVIRNNWVENFNASVKVNGKNGAFPDNGIIEYNAFVNSRPRATDKPVALLDFVAASGWLVRKNLIADFAKAGGNHTSYGAFFKGAGEDSIFEQNVVRCEWRHGGGARVGFSFGDGGTGRRHCRDKECQVEHRGGIARNNIIMNCPNDVGISLYKSAETAVHNNALIDTRGIDLRGSVSDAMIVNNIVDGRILARDGARYTAAANVVSALKAAFLADVSSGLYADPKRGDLRVNDIGPLLGPGAPVRNESSDLCDQPYDSRAPHLGPILYNLVLPCTPTLN